MRKILLVTVGLLNLPALGHAVEDCPGCVLGLYDAADMLHNYGTITPWVPKDIYLGITLDGVETGVATVEFSISGLDGSQVIVADVKSVTDPAAMAYIGSAPAPADTLRGGGGMDVLWSSCISGSRALLQVRLVWLSDVPPVNQILRVRHKYPPNNPYWGLSNPIVLRCEQQNYTAVRVTGGCYILGYNSAPMDSPCPLPTVPVEGKTWSGVKDLYRDATR